MIARTLLLLGLSGMLLLPCRAAEMFARQRAWSDEMVAAKFKRAKTDPEELWDLRSAPADKIFDRLMRMWLDSDFEYRMVFPLYPGGEDEWAKIPKIVGRKLSGADRSSFIARRILSTHDEIDQFANSRMERACDIFRRRLEIGKRAGRKEYVTTRTEMFELLKLAVIRAEEGGHTIIHLGLQCPDERDPAQDNYVETTPPYWALWAISERLKSVLKPDYSPGMVWPAPTNLEAARDWWWQNVFAICRIPQPYSEPDPLGWTEASVARVILRSETDPCAIRELHNVPLAVTFRKLMPIFTAGLRRQQAVVTNLGGNLKREETASQHAGGEGLERSEERFSYVQEILAERSDGEAFAIGRLKKLNQLFAARQAQPRFVRRDNFETARKEALDLLHFAVIRAGNDGFRIIGSFLSSPMVMDPSQRRGETPPAAWARAALADRMIQRWDEVIPADIEGARIWWTQNSHRFEGESHVLPAVPGAVGFVRTDLQFYGAGPAPFEFSQSVELVVQSFFKDQTQPAEFSLLVAVKSGRSAKFLLPFNHCPELEELLKRIEVPDRTSSAGFLLRGDVAGGWRHERVPNDTRAYPPICGTGGIEDVFESLLKD